MFSGLGHGFIIELGILGKVNVGKNSTDVFMNSCKVTAKIKQIIRIKSKNVIEHMTNKGSTDCASVM